MHGDVWHGMSVTGHGDNITHDHISPHSPDHEHPFRRVVEASDDWESLWIDIGGEG